MRPSAFTILLLLAGGAPGCASTPFGSAVPYKTGGYETTVRASTEQSALDGAAASARDTCRLYRQQARVVERRTRYLGLARHPDNAEQVANLVRHAHAAGFPSLAANEDVEATLRFTCLAPSPATAPVSAAG